MSGGRYLLVVDVGTGSGRSLLFDEDGNSYETATLTTYVNAKRAIRRWLQRYGFNVADAYRLISLHFSAKAA